ncbi:MAG: penicillin-binding protein activator [Desulfobacteraceae bacterium]
MNLKLLCSNKAVPVLMAGLAFFLAHCQPKAPPEAGKEPLQADSFAAAEAFDKQGELDKALGAYQAFLRDQPRAERSPLALDRMAEIYVRLGDPQKAVTALKQIETSYPHYGDLPRVRYRLAGLYFDRGQYRECMDAALKWLEKYPSHPLTPDIYVLLGDSAVALNHRVQAFRWWLKAEEMPSIPSEKTGPLSERLHALIDDSGIDTLERMARIAAGSLYAPPLYHRLASLYLMGDDPASARKAATALLQATDDPKWISRGNELMARIRERLAVREGVVGCLLPLTGPFAIYGETALNGIALGNETLSATHGMSGLEIVIRDTQGDPQKTRHALEELVRREKVMTVVGPLSSKTATAAAQKAQELGIPLITLTHKQGIPQMGDMVFRHLLTPPQEIEGLLEGVMGKMGLDRYAILHPDNPYGRFCMHLFQDKLKARGGTLTAVEAYDPDRTDFAGPIQRLVHLSPSQPPSVQEKLARMWIPEKEEEAIYPEAPQPLIEFDALFIPDTFQRVAMIAPQLAFYDVLGVRLLGTSPWQSPELIKMAGEHVQEAIFTSGFFEGSESADVRDFSSRYRDYFDAEPDTLAAAAYDTIRLLGEVLQQGAIRTRKDFKAALLAHGHFQGFTGRVYFGPEGEAHQTPILLTVSGKAFARDPACMAIPGKNVEQAHSPQESSIH